MTENRTETTVETLGLIALGLVVLCSAATFVACGAFTWFRITEMMARDGDSALSSAMAAAGM